MTRKKIWACGIVLIVLTVCALGAAFFVARTRIGAEAAIKTVTHSDTISSLVPIILGFDKPRTVLFLFLNNTELRPGGGFIGTYGTATLDHAVPQNLMTAGTENLDHNAPATFKVDPPQPIKDHLIAQWYFRDSNWSPDFAISSQQALKFYSAEGGANADKIQTVIGVTPAVLQTILKYTGPITVGGKTYNEQNITDALEQEVEIDFRARGIPLHERKVVISDIAHELAARAVHISPTEWYPLMNDLLVLETQGQVMFYDVNADVQKTIETLGWGGRIHAGTPDYVMMVDANLGSLKTDRVMERGLSYEIFREKNNSEWRGRIVATYKNNASAIDWRTTRYQTYVRFYLPEGTRVLSDAHRAWDVSTENGKTVIGTYVVTEPGTTNKIEFNISLAPTVVAAIGRGEYGLYIQKQLGLPNFNLTIHHDFGTSVRTATPPEDAKNFGDAFYDWSRTLNQDSEFTVKL